jgi:hypothetical protein
MPVSFDPTVLAKYNLHVKQEDHRVGWVNRREDNMPNVRYRTEQWQTQELEQRASSISFHPTILAKHKLHIANYVKQVKN